MRYIAKQLPCQSGRDANSCKRLVFRKEDGVFNRQESSKPEAGGHPEPRWLFSADGSRLVAPASRLRRRQRGTDRLRIKRAQKHESPDSQSGLCSRN
jgi:hypothetical protein